MRLREHGKLILVLAASYPLFAQRNDLPVKSQSPSSVPDVRQIVEASIAATRRSWRARYQYTYLQRDEDRRLDAAGRVKSEEVEVSRMIPVNGLPFEQLVEHNGRSLSALEELNQEERLSELKRLTPVQRAERLRKAELENTSLVQELPKAYDFQLEGEEVVNERPAYVLKATPHPSYHAQGRYGKMFSRMEGKLWIDKQDFGWIKAEGQVIEPFSLELFLVRLLRGSRITMEQIRVNDGNWVPQHVEVRAAATIFYVKSLVIDRVLTYTEYRLAEGVAPVGRN
jgi:hypothetical protein